ncbi:MAG: LysR family transcriptional regulator [Blastocatellia bacterium]|nr:LysR family transcriptional regulator [Blastocatellia bacterium]
MNLQAIDLNLLLAFEALMDERNVTRAAQRIGLSQSAMSNALARLRRTFDDPLLVRGVKGMTPTPAAQALIVPVRAALAQLREAVEEKPRFDEQASQTVFHLLTSDYAEIILLAPLLERLRARARGVRLQIHRLNSLFESPAPASLSDSFDLALGFFPDAPALDTSLHSEVLWSEQNVCITRANHPTIKGKLSLRQYAAAHHIGVFYKSLGPGLIDALLAQKGHSRHLAVLVPHFASVPFLVAASDLIATVPESLARRFSEQVEIQILPLPFAIPAFRLTMLWHKRNEADPAHQWLRKMITETSAQIRR